MQESFKNRYKKSGGCLWTVFMAVSVLTMATGLLALLMGGDHTTTGIVFVIAGGFCLSITLAICALLYVQWKREKNGTANTSTPTKKKEPNTTPTRWYHTLIQNLLTGCICLLAILLLVGFVGGVLYFSIGGVINMEHYLKVHQDPLTVNAVVTHHAENYSADSSTYYNAFVTYVVDGTQYVDIEYEEVGDKKDLTPVGQQVTLLVSSKDPSTTIDVLQENNKVTLLWFPAFWAALLTLLTAILFTLVWQEPNSYPNPEDIQRFKQDARRKVLTGSGRIACAWYCVIMGILYLRYTIMFSTFFKVLFYLSVALVIVCIFITISELNHIRKGQFKICQSTLIKKDHTVDSDGNKHYSLYYEGPTHWSKSVTESQYHTAEIGEQILTLYLAKSTNPLLSYDPKALPVEEASPEENPN